MDCKMDCKMDEHGPSLAIATVPWQKWRDVMDGGCGLQKGTIFEELVKPFYGAKAACDVNFTRGNRQGRQEHQANEMRRNNMGRGCGCR